MHTPLTIVQQATLDAAHVLHASCLQLGRLSRRRHITDRLNGRDAEHDEQWQDGWGVKAQGKGLDPQERHHGGVLDLCPGHLCQV